MSRRQIDPTVLPGYLPPEQRLCRWCKKPMRPEIVWEEMGEDDSRPVGPNVYKTAIGRREAAVRIAYYGYDRHNRFCSLQCGYRYACAVVP